MQKKKLKGILKALVYIALEATRHTCYISHILRDSLKSHITTFIHSFFHSLYQFSVTGGGAYLSCYWVRGGVPVHPGQATLTLATHLGSILDTSIKLTCFGAEERSRREPIQSGTL